MSRSTMKLLFSFLCIYFIILQTIAEPQKNYENVCAAQQTCSQCLQTPYCVWCSEMRDFRSNGPLTRCTSRERYLHHNNNWCSEQQVVANKSFIEIIDNIPLRSKKGRTTIQVQPQRVRVVLRRGEEQKIILKYSKAEDYPVDLYYLMDLSASMEPYREQLSKLGGKLADTMRNLTKNFRLGFGSFVDKVTLPMTSTHPDMLESPCHLNNSERCASPYSYKNQMPLTENWTLFTISVKQAPVSGNLDGPEGGFDAVMQAIECTNEIGWREKARRLLIFSTDASFHIAGDGRLAGIVEPNDGLCHLDQNGSYTHSLLQDYPSISQINQKAKKHNINIIFTIPKHMNTTYQLLSKSIGGSSIGLLENDTNNVVSLVSKQYEKLIDSVILTDDAHKIIDVRYFSKCFNENSVLKERNECDGVRVDNVAQFEIILKALDCPLNISERSQTIHIGPRGLTEHLQLDIQIICDCSCDEPGDKNNVRNSPFCRGNGNLTCGICSCHDGFYGKQCECKGSEYGENLITNCKANDKSEVCSGRGTCKCGICECSKRINPQEQFSGNYCECDNFSCKRSGGLLCGEHGRCECGNCNCFPGWTGDTCDCKDDNSTCMPSDESSVVCSGKGECICGVCHCHNTAKVRYSGTFCEECTNCPGQNCDDLKDCVECLLYNTGQFWHNKQCTGCPHDIELVETDEKNESDTWNNKHRMKTCRMLIDNGCTVIFKYDLIEDPLSIKNRYFRVQVHKKENCHTALNAMGIALGVVTSTVVIGFLILLTWKLITAIHDRREFAKFQEERSMVRWERGQNPFYKQATTTFNNPTFKCNSKTQNN